MSSHSIPGYVLKKKLGAGAMAAVFLARDEKLHRDVALKVMSKKLLADPSFVERFQREARIVASVSHRNIVTVFDVGSHNDFHYMAMEFLPGGDLSSKLKQGISLQQAIAYITDIAEGLHYAASKNLIHRDIKPDNIMFAEDGRAVITDFGIARDASSESNMTMAGSVIGTPQYMSPEQAGAKQLDHRSDLYSLGIILYQMLTGKTPFKGDSAISTGIMHITEAVPPLPERYRRFQDFIDVALAKNPDERFQSGKDFLRSLSRINLEMDEEADLDATVILNSAATPSSDDLLGDLSEEFLATTAPPIFSETKPQIKPVKATNPAILPASATELTLTRLEVGEPKVRGVEAKIETQAKTLKIPRSVKVTLLILLLLFAPIAAHIVYVNVLGKQIPFQAMATSLNELSKDVDKDSSADTSKVSKNFYPLANRLQKLSNRFGQFTANILRTSFATSAQVSLNPNEEQYLELIQQAIKAQRYFAPPMNNAEYYLKELHRLHPESKVVSEQADALMLTSIQAAKESIKAGQMDEAKLIASKAEQLLPYVRSSHLKNEFRNLLATFN